jgi:hypothetical protein
MGRVLVHEPSGKRIELISTETISIDNRVSRLDPCLIALLNVTVEAHPRCVGNSTIQAILSRFSRASQSVYKLIGEVKTWSDANALPQLISNKRGQGYMLSDHWAIELSEDPQIDEVFTEIQVLCEETIAEVKKARFQSVVSGLHFLGSRPGLPQQNFSRLHVASWKLLFCLAVLPTAKPPLILRLQKSLFELVSYVTFWRIATRFEEDAWKDEFIQELTALLDEVDMLVRRIRSR